MTASTAPSTPTRVIITRPAQQAPAWATALTEAGFEVALLPLIEIAPLPAPTPPAALPDLAQYQAIFPVSPNAIDGLVHWLGAAALQNASCRFLCPGAGTAQVLLALGVAASRIVQPPAELPQDSEQLWLHLQAQAPLQAGQALLIVQGQDAGHAPGSNWLGQQAGALGVQVASISTYQRSAPDMTVAQAELAQAAAQDGSVWIFSSSQAIANLITLLPEQSWAGTPCITTHARIAQTARQHGFQPHICQPQLNDIAHALHRLGT